MSLKPWPLSPQLVSLLDLLLPLLTVINTNDSSRYDGYDIGEDTKATCPSPDVFLSLADSGDDLGSLRGRALTVAFQLGIEQGRRLHPTRPTEGLSPRGYMSLIGAATRAFVDASGWTEGPCWETTDGKQRYLGDGPVWTPPGGGDPVTYNQALARALGSL